MNVLCCVPDLYWWRVIYFKGASKGAALLYPLKPGVSRGQPGLSGGPGPLRPPRNSTTASRTDRQTEDGTAISVLRVAFVNADALRDKSRIRHLLDKFVRCLVDGFIWIKLDVHVVDELLLTANACVCVCVFASVCTELWAAYGSNMRTGQASDVSHRRSLARRAVISDHLSLRRACVWLRPSDLSRARLLLSGERKVVEAGQRK